MAMARTRRLLLLGCGLEQIEALRVARELGYRTIAFDDAAAPAGRSFADEFVRVPLKDEAALLGQAELAAPDGVFVHAAELAVEAARVSEHLDLPGLSVESARHATEKHLRIATLAAAGIRTPRFEILETAAPLEAWIEGSEAIAYPKVLKPTNQAGARGVQQVSSPAELATYYADRTRYGCDHFVCEERLEGIQLSTESVLIDGKPRHHAIALRHYDTTDHLLPWFIEDGHSYPWTLPPSRSAEVESLIERCFGVLGMDDGVLKGDLLITAGGEIHVLEMAARTSGGRFADTVVPLSTGVDILYPLIEWAMGDGFSRDWFTPTRSRGVSQRFFLHAGVGRVKRWPLLRRLVAQPGVHETRIDEGRLRSGRLPPIRSHRDRLGYVICTGETREDADRLALGITRAFGQALVVESEAGGSPP